MKIGSVREAYFGQESIKEKLTERNDTTFT